MPMPVRRCQQAVTLLVLVAALQGTLSASARASDSVSFIASLTGSAITVTATGNADPCPYCLAGQSERQLVIGATEVTSSYPSCPDSPAAGPLMAVAVPDTGGTVSTSVTFPVQSGASYRLCAGIEQQESSTFESLAEAPMQVLTVPPGPCPAGTRPVFSVRLAPRIVRGRSYTVTIRPSAAPLSVDPPAELVGSAALGVLNLTTYRYIATRTIAHARLSTTVIARLPGLNAKGRYELILAGQQSQPASPGTVCDRAVTRSFWVTAPHP